MVYDSFELDEERSIDEVTVTQTSDRLAIRLTLDRETLTIDARPNSEASNGPLSSGALAYVSEPNEEGVGFNIMYLPDQYVVGSSYSVSQSPSDRDGIGRLAFTAAPSGDVEEMIAATTQARSDNAAVLEQSRDAFEGDGDVSEGVGVLATGTSNVYVETWSIPFFLDGGWAEGAAHWSTTNNPYVKIVSRVNWSVDAVWPSDGVSLWHDGQNSVVAWDSPAFPPGGAQVANGPWSIDTRTGSLVAESTVSALVGGVPLMWALYDTATI